MLDPSLAYDIRNNTTNIGRPPPQEQQQQQQQRHHLHQPNAAAAVVLAPQQRSHMDSNYGVMHANTHAPMMSQSTPAPYGHDGNRQNDFHAGLAHESGNLGPGMPPSSVRANGFAQFGVGGGDHVQSHVMAGSPHVPIQQPAVLTAAPPHAPHGPPHSHVDYATMHGIPAASGLPAEAAKMNVTGGPPVAPPNVIGGQDLGPAVSPESVMSSTSSGSYSANVTPPTDSRQMHVDMRGKAFHGEVTASAPTGGLSSMRHSGAPPHSPTRDVNKRNGVGSGINPALTSGGGTGGTSSTGTSPLPAMAHENQGNRVDNGDATASVEQESSGDAAGGAATTDAQQQSGTSETPATPVPSPHTVGREFVRQYFTLVGHAPLHLHRFYSANSSFVHGDAGEENVKPVIGQHEIHRRIMELNLRNCRTKVRQIDASSTADGGVVIQVSGQLSNNDGPLRPFVQTFVLARQSPRKFYVHNNIFRYQDVAGYGDSSSGAAAASDTGVTDASGKLVANEDTDFHRHTQSGTVKQVVLEEKRGVPDVASSAATTGLQTVGSTSVATPPQQSNYVSNRSGSGSTAVGPPPPPPVAAVQQTFSPSQPASLHHQQRPTQHGCVTTSATASPGAPSAATSVTVSKDMQPPLLATPPSSTQFTVANSKAAKESNAWSAGPQPSAGAELQGKKGMCNGYGHGPTVVDDASGGPVDVGVGATAADVAAAPPLHQPVAMSGARSTVAPPVPVAPDAAEKQGCGGSGLDVQAASYEVAAASTATASPAGTTTDRVAEVEKPLTYASLFAGRQVPANATSSTDDVKSAEAGAEGVDFGSGSQPSVAAGPVMTENSAYASHNRVNSSARPNSRSSNNRQSMGGRQMATGSAAGHRHSMAGGKDGPASSQPTGQSSSNNGPNGGVVTSTSYGNLSNGHGGGVGTSGPPTSAGGGGSGVPMKDLYPDSQQVFIGNLPHTCTERELFELFAEFGKVLDIRISYKQQQQSGGHSSWASSSVARKPNIGFVVFDSQAAVANCLSRRSVFLNGHRINVEEKKTRQQSHRDFNSYGRSGGGSGGGSYDGYHGGGGSYQQQHHQHQSSGYGHQGGQSAGGGGDSGSGGGPQQHNRPGGRSGGFSRSGGGGSSSAASSTAAGLGSGHRMAPVHHTAAQR